MEIILWAALYLTIGWFLSDLMNKDDDGGGSFVVFVFWPMIMAIWVTLMITVVIPDSIRRWYRYRKYRKGK